MKKNSCLGDSLYYLLWEAFEELRDKSRLQRTKELMLTVKKVKEFFKKEIAGEIDTL